MQLNDALKHVAVVGAAGKMGRGISLLLLQEMARIEAEAKGAVVIGGRQLILVDESEENLPDLRKYLQQNLFYYAEKNIISLREYYAANPALTSNEEIIRDFVDGALSLVLFSPDIIEAQNATMIFEAVIEDINIKIEVLKSIAQERGSFYYTNTSSIPISILNKKAELNGHLIGFHFYNPPTVQRLIELIFPPEVNHEARQLGLDLAKRLNKTVIESADVAGFIGNGHFMREIIFACRQAEELSKTIPFEEGIFLVNRITQDYLVRPMGIFQLMDYVGVDVCQRVLQTMRTYLHDEYFQDTIIDRMVELGAVGGQFADGSQKEGFFRYEHHVPTAVFCMEKRSYRSFYEGQWVEDIKRVLGKLPDNWVGWKRLHKDPEAQEKITTYFQQLFEEGTAGSEVAIDFLLKSKEISEQLVSDGVAKNIEDVNTVLQKGFYHLYGADIPWFDHASAIRSNICDI